MATNSDRKWNGMLLALGAMALPAVLTTGCLGGPLSEDGDGDAHWEFIDPWWEDECAGMGSSSSGSSGFGAPSVAAEAARAIGEADIIKIEDDLIYALSDQAGLTIIEASNPDALAVLDSAQTIGEAFEMYVRDGTVYAMSTTDYSGATVIQALDASDPGDILPSGNLTLPGEVSDSRIIGQLLYVVTFDPDPEGSWSGTPVTYVTSLSIAEPNQLTQVDQLAFPADDPHDFGWKRSVYATDDRMYVAGVEWDNQENDGHSTIQVVDISDPTGLLVEGALVEPAGQIYSRWQMSERDGVLRVISQPGIFNDADVPKVETFTVQSSAEVTPLGFIEMELPMPESLRSVRFDGTIAYVITAALSEPWDPSPKPPPPSMFAGDPLFVIDLTDPAHPVQRGELEIPGWVYHMEVRGSRLLALGFDGNNPEGMINVSLFDVSNLDAPSMIERVSFGGQYSGVEEDQNRIHKAFSIFDDEGIIVVPFSDVEEHTDSDPCWGSSTWYEEFGAMQLIQFDDNSLTKRGKARMSTQIRRARLHQGRLLGLSNFELRVFDITELGVPKDTNGVWF